MKTYQSTVEGNWIELLQVELTEEQKALMVSNNKEDIEAKKELTSLIKSQREGTVAKDKTAELNSFYNKVKPVLKETDVYQLISADLSEANYFKGILNYRVNGGHKQRRF